jgi:hypothetical protein
MDCRANWNPLLPLDGSFPIRGVRMVDGVNKKSGGKCLMCSFLPGRQLPVRDSVFFLNARHKM